MATKTVPESVEERPTTVDFYFSSKGKVQPKGFDNLTVDEDITVITKGKVNSVAHKQDPDWDPGKSFKLNITSCEIAAPAKKTSLDDAIKAAKKKV